MRLLSRLLSPTAAAPLLGPGLMKIARTPRARLQVGYHVVPRLGRCIAAPLSGCCQCAPAVPAKVADCVPLIPLAWRELQVPWFRPLGVELLLDRLLLGGIVGERLPLSNLICEAAQRGPLPTGALVDLVA